ncbi:hypothetical protein BGW37DRAFT_508162 [Umbelopsis sp. PMI_123]|nr:hypothetical protein BGW37DRAFT_508162 [Umbelopsis sp. PMI_123]
MQDSDRFEEASANIGSYMLQGWILTDEQCPQPNCPTPLLRSKNGQQKICVVHDLPGKSVSNNNVNLNVFKQLAADKPVDRFTDNEHSASQVDIEEDHEAEEFIRRVNERSKENDSIASLRREQSKLASQRIGQKLLQQWTLVNDVCPNDTCYAVPLVRDQQQRLFCVICERSYMNENTYLQSVRKRESESDTPKASVEPPAPSKPAFKTIMQDVNLRDLDIDIEDPDLISSQLQMLSKNSEIHIPPQSSATNNSVTSALPSAKSNLLSELKEKVDRLSQDAITTQDPVALVKLFEAIKAGSEAIEAYRRIC